LKRLKGLKVEGVEEVTGLKGLEILFFEKIGFREGFPGGKIQ